MKPRYVLYFGRYAEEKGVGTLLEAAAELPEIQFVFAGRGPLRIDGPPNVTDLGFQSAGSIQRLIKNAVCTVLPALWYEPFGMTVTESQILGTPVIGAGIGGITELIEEEINGELFESGNTADLKEKLARLWNDDELVKRYRGNCLRTGFCGVDKYFGKLMDIYSGEVCRCVRAGE